MMGKRKVEPPITAPGSLSRARSNAGILDGESANGIQFVVLIECA